MEVFIDHLDTRTGHQRGRPDRSPSRHGHPKLQRLPVLRPERDDLRELLLDDLPAIAAKPRLQPGRPCPQGHRHRICATQAQKRGLPVRRPDGRLRVLRHGNDRWQRNRRLVFSKNEFSSESGKRLAGLPEGPVRAHTLGGIPARR
ncbi:MAG TPA: hypothetical protein PLV33_03880 [Opitutaceae bacterium]|nr:hypothetical protein [Opitutaceae bacterium]